VRLLLALTNNLKVIRTTSLEHGTVCRPISDYVGCHTASSGVYWRHSYSDSEATAHCKLFLTAQNRNVLTYLLTLIVFDGKYGLFVFMRSYSECEKIWCAVNFKSSRNKSAEHTGVGRVFLYNVSQSTQLPVDICICCTEWTRSYVMCWWMVRSGGWSIRFNNWLSHSDAVMRGMPSSGMKMDILLRGGTHHFSSIVYYTHLFVNISNNYSGVSQIADGLESLESHFVDHPLSA